MPGAEEPSMAEPRVPPAGEPASSLDRALVDLGRALDYPPTPDLAARLHDVLQGEPPRMAPRPRFDYRRRWLVAAVIVALIAGALLLFPEARTAIADRIGLPGVSIRWLEETPPPRGAVLSLGDRVTRAEAQAGVSFPVAVPTHSGFADPPEVYLLGEGDEAMVSFVYPATATLPSSQVPGVGALLTQFAGRAERDLVVKGLSGLSDARTHLEAVTVAGAPGFWITGAPHGVLLACGDEGECREEPYRLAGNVLLWERDGVILRLESALSREASLDLAESIEPPG